MNILDEVRNDLKVVREDIAQMKALLSSPQPKRMAMPEFCKQYNITRQTAYEWARRNLIELEKIAGRQYVRTESITVTKKAERQQAAA
ncbi:MAG TPA: hypothetical protein VK658_13935 [Chryseolinea sp.]|nr:hypothetical protein [Chryseolinea sp.]